MPPEFAQQLQQLFARQMAVVYLHRCARHDVPVNLVAPRLEDLEHQGDEAACAALLAEFTTAEPAGNAEPAGDAKPSADADPA
ncbi:MAG: hypothetical protein ACKO6F_07765 [Cyanobium sp.]